MSDWDAKKLGGSIKREIVNPDLQEERDKLTFDLLEFEKFVFTEELYHYAKRRNDMFANDPNL